uniref:unspecific monooxygenase n=1 Tax=Plutella xylostella TaxID=51655 RepID=A0A0A7DH57_PLUXY|nr:P450 CYP6 family protein 3 [Plutella xylostella]
MVGSNINTLLRQYVATVHSIMAALSMVFAALILVITLLYFLHKSRYSYWKKRNVPYLEPTPLLGNYGPYILLRETVGEVVSKILQQFPDEPVVGAFYGTEPALLVQDLQLLKLITTKDYYYFSSREISNHTHKEVMTQSLFFTYGDNWRVLRQNLTPMFSSAKMKNMFYLIVNCSKEFEKVLDKEIEVNDVIDARDMLARFTMDCIGTCVFGIETRAMENEKGNPFWDVGASIFGNTYSRSIRWITRAIWPAIFYGLGFKTFPGEASNFFGKFVGEVFKERMKTDAKRQDFIDLLSEFKRNSTIVGDKMSNMKTSSSEKVSIEVTDEILISQCMAFFAAGYETSANTGSLTLYELAKHPEAQQRVLDEVDRYLRARENKLGYDCLTELPYLEQCISETMRLYPVLTVLTRELVDDYSLPGGLRLPRGLRVHIPVLHLQLHPRYFPEPRRFRPERFSPEERHNLLPYTYMPFGEGPRICIGMRFARMQMMAGIITILKKYRVELAAGMSSSLTLDPRAIVTMPRERLRLRLVPRAGWDTRLYQ